MARFTVVLLAVFAAMAVAFSPAPAFKKAALVSPTALNVDIKVVVGEGEPIESALRRFKREVNKSGHLMELRHRRFFENSQEKKKRKIVQARNRRRLERMQKRRMSNRT
uniref:30S ribosomal protein S21 n=1 Tax=Pseudictyota dubia TaxID=2749911 RepID=A0A7R9W5B5_9STRA|mmetsp:Transcript_3404/g.5947  ORF Transcript_3404/g.5947 Transcript_3404/m.5947 type:complete len:109 (+) Transcript_3404:45-371(+)|eukprot:CAMPEP_0197438610 /NCGR_PEP_ID=MMETSP1175-20131217/5542_1 /TAXON_ID=1003142 /ORGANISM="Triceratium dubium, Strain CCMP147" /LENGTH=108 /DNA_ID=CAMNT_0042968365 /DNA_START=44 /DNA_END=370 /DNA_ORIENTATION=-